MSVQKTYSPESCNPEWKRAREELGEEDFARRMRQVFGVVVLDFVETIVINLPESCYANCEYCIDNGIRHNRSAETEKFLQIAEKLLGEFPAAKNVCLTGGTLKANAFNRLLCLIRNALPDAFVSWNTNGIGLDGGVHMQEAIEKINVVNLHRNSVDEAENLRVFKTNRKIPTIAEAKAIVGNKLCLRVTVDEQFALEDYIDTGISLYINRLLPGNEKTDAVFRDTLRKLDVQEHDAKRRNVYLSSMRNDVPVRVCLGDKLATHVPGRQAVYLNVAILHRSGKASGSWFEDDKLIFSPVQSSPN